MDALQTGKKSQYNNLRHKVDVLGSWGYPLPQAGSLNHSDATKPPLDAPFVPQHPVHGFYGWKAPWKPQDEPKPCNI